MRKLSLLLALIYRQLCLLRFGKWGKLHLLSAFLSLSVVPACFVIGGADKVNQ